MELEFQYNTIITTINSNKDSKMIDACQQFCTKEKTSLNKVSFLYSGKILKNELELTIQNVANNNDNERNKMNLLVIGKEENIIQEEKSKLIKSKNIVCPQCGELSKISIEDYRYKISECKNYHETNNISVNKLQDNLMIDISKIIYDECRINKSVSEQKDFYRCNACQKNLCSICKTRHNKEHKIIEYEEKDFICESHNEKYIYYCKDCKKNLCKNCFSEHEKHDISNYENIIIDNEINNEDLNVNLNNVKENIEKIILRWKTFSSKFEQVINYFETYYNFYKHIISSYDNNYINYETLDNIIYLKNSSIIKDINKLNNSNDLNFLNDIFNIHYNITTPNINEILMVYTIKENVNNKINLFGKKFVENNKDKCIIDVEGEKMELISEYNLKNKSPGDILLVKLIGFKNIDDISYMFDGCDSLISIPKFEKINTYKFNDMSGLFSGCSSLTELPDISEWNTSNVKKFVYMFSKCESLKSIPDISKWNTWKVNDIKGMFNECKSLISIPDLSKWNTSQIIDIKYLFYNCSSLDTTKIQFISKWDLPRLFYTLNMTKGCNGELKDNNNFELKKLWSNIMDSIF